MKKIKKTRMGAMLLASALAFSSMTTLTAFAAADDGEPNGQVTAQTEEQSAGLVFPEKLVMETPKALGSLDLSGCKGGGTFAFAETSFIPVKGMSSCLLVFTPGDTDKYQYDTMTGWDTDTETVRRYVQVVCTSLKKAEDEKKNGEAAATPAETTVPEATETTVPEATETTVPEATETTVPEATETTVPEATETTVPEATETTVPEATETTVPEATETTVPEATETTVPEAIITAIPEATETTTPEAAAAVTLETQAADAQIRNLAAEISSEEQVQKVLEATRAYEVLTEEQKTQISEETLHILWAAQSAAAVYNHTDSGVTVTGNVPWHVRLKVSVDDQGASYVPTGLETIVPYEMMLWDLMTDSDYVLPGGEKVTLSMALPENLYLYDGLTVVHYLDDSRFEYLELRIEGTTMSFETSSFSPFSVAGSRPLVGGKNENTSSSAGKENGSSSAQTSGAGSSASKKNTSAASLGKKKGIVRPVLAPQTGDSARTGLFAVLGVAAIAIITGVIITLIVRKKRK